MTPAKIRDPMSSLTAESAGPAPPDLTQYIVKIDDQYIAGGGFGDVYKCLYTGGLKEQEVAVKALRFKSPLDGYTEDKSAKGLRRELGIWKRLIHTNIVPFLGIAYGFGMCGAMSLVSLWMPNGTLHNFLAVHGNRLAAPHRLQILYDVCKGLHYLHSFPVVHGDLKSDNVLLDADYTARLADFGHASLAGDIPEAYTYLQRSTCRPGAIRWIAPEQVDEETYRVTAKSDIYSLGCIALQGSPTRQKVFSGKQPWSEVRMEPAVIKHLCQGHTPGRPESRTMNDSHWSFIQRCWLDRPATDIILPTIERLLSNCPPFGPLRDLFVLPSSQTPDSLLDDSSMFLTNLKGSGTNENLLDNRMEADTADAPQLAKDLEQLMREPSPLNDGHQSKQGIRPSCNIVLFGEPRVGKSSVINLIADEDVAGMTPSDWRCSVDSKQYLIKSASRTINIWETVGLGEPSFGTLADYLGAIEKTYLLIQQIAAQGGPDLLLFCIRSGSHMPTILCNYRLFFQVLCAEQIPIALVVHPEKNTRMDDWWDQNMRQFDRWGLRFSKHACITVMPRYPEREKSRAALVDLLVHHDPETRHSMPSPACWFSSFLERLPLIPCPQELKDTRSKLELQQVLHDRCMMDNDNARRHATNLSQSMHEPSSHAEDYQSKNHTKMGSLNVLFGEAGVGKSSIINLIADEDVAKTSPDAKGRTFRSTRYTFSLKKRTFNIWDTIGLGEPLFSPTSYVSAIAEMRTVVQQIEANGGLDLLLFCIPGSGSRITQTMLCNYRLFFEVFCGRKIPISVVVTRLEGEARMEEWWKRNEAHINESGLKFGGHACVTGDRKHEKAAEGRAALESLLLSYDSKARYPMPPADAWFLGFLERLSTITRSNALKGKRREVEQLLRKRCMMDSDVAEKLAEKLTQ